MAKTLRDGDWLDSERAIGYARIILAVSAVAAILWVAAADRGIDIAGKPLGTDFLAFWSAGQLAISGHPASAYDLAQLYAVERGAVAEDPGIACFLYPPAFLLIVAPLAIFPYFAALPLWLAATGAAYWRAMRRWIGDVPHGRLALLAYPALAANLGHGQNGFLTAALLAGGLSQIDRRPVVAGALLGAMVIKPQLALALPVMALAGQRWQLT
ncbi:MAG: glycosyltransferase family 87 protein, partial [Sphingomonas sp.]